MIFNTTQSASNECTNVVDYFYNVHKDQTARLHVQVLFGILYAMIFVIGLLGNGLVIASVWKYPPLQTVRNFFIVSLSCSDMVVCLTSLPITPFMIIKKNWLFGSFLCYAFPLFQGMSICISTFTLMAVAIDRYILIVFPTRRPIQRNQAVPMIIGIWALAAGVCLPMLAHYKHYYGPDRPSELQLEIDNLDHTSLHTMATSTWTWNGTQTATMPTNVTVTPTESHTPLPLFCGYFCDEAWPSERVQKIYGTFVLILQFLVPLLVIAICYSHIWFRVSRSAKMKKALLGTRRKYPPKNNNNNEHTQLAPPDQQSAVVVLEARQQAVLRRQRRTNRMLIAMVFIFACSWFPQVLVNLLRDLYWLPEFVWQQLYLYSLLCHVIAMTSTIWNPLLYSFMNGAFRSAFTELLPCLRPCNRAYSKKSVVVEARKSVQLCTPDDQDSNIDVKCTASTKMTTDQSPNENRRRNSTKRQTTTSETCALLPMDNIGDIKSSGTMNGDAGYAKSIDQV